MHWCRTCILTGDEKLKDKTTCKRRPRIASKPDGKRPLQTQNHKLQTFTLHSKLIDFCYPHHMCTPCPPAELIASPAPSTTAIGTQPPPSN